MAFSFTPQPQPQQQSPFQPSPFSQTTPFQQPHQFQFQPQQPQLQQQQTQHPQQLYLLTSDKSPATYSTKWDDLHPDSRKLLLQIEEKILEYRDESQRLDQCSRLYDSSVSSQGFELDASQIVQDLGGINMSMERQKAILQELMTVVKDMLKNAEVAVRSYMMLRPRFLQQNKAAAASATTPSQTSGATVGLTSSNPPPTNSMMPVFDFYSGIPKKPSPFLQQTIARFEKFLSDCRQWIEDLEQLIILDSDKNSFNSSSSLLQSLPKVMKNVHDFFVHVAAKVESIHQHIESMKTTYLADQRCRGDGNDPFLEADRRETAKQEAAARRVHPTLHLPAVCQPSTQVAGLLTSSAATGTSTTPISASSGSGTSLFATPSAVTSLSLFSTPTTSAPVSSLFASSGVTPQTSPLGSLSVSTSAFGTSAPLFSSTPSGPSTSSTPFATGAATGSGASFGTISARAKSRTGRR
ncbi:nuclear pore complex protein NUP58 isoform X2 [Olea europaea var. sylvestris]|uniref:nuclear pore complex protein NUP58 isoform X2 n=1 Tax=Olea europaea var. sylvestris TaxID=158386 RepID=UPI000C1CD0B9|nr:nuclear pore complex protein NUP58 isoform X2 [Olea europaea var. sylvestris]